MLQLFRFGIIILLLVKLSLHLLSIFDLSFICRHLSVCTQLLRDGNEPVLFLVITVAFCNTRCSYTYCSLHLLFTANVFTIWIVFSVLIVAHDDRFSSMYSLCFVAVQTTEIQYVNVGFFEAMEILSLNCQYFKFKILEKY